MDVSHPLQLLHPREVRVRRTTGRHAPALHLLHHQHLLLLLLLLLARLRLRRRLRLHRLYPLLPALEAEAHVPLLEVAALAAAVPLDRQPRLERLAPLPLRLLEAVPPVADRVVGAAGQELRDEGPLASRLSDALQDGRVLGRAPGSDGRGARLCLLGGASRRLACHGTRHQLTGVGGAAGSGRHGGGRLRRRLLLAWLARRLLRLLRLRHRDRLLVGLQLVWLEIVAH
mmetsp:Transcript_39926/g.125226  ORF Transcript_39926/g.125226 Transcript_39926/m.125226 type:complete len:229 (-) Transcript_39926:498-1184(-)